MNEFILMKLEIMLTTLRKKMVDWDFCSKFKQYDLN